MSQSVQMKLGDFKFSLSTASYHKLTKTYGWNWAAAKRFQQHDSLQFTGKNNPKIKIDGVVFPEFTASAFSFSSVGIYQVDTLTKLADKGEPLLLISGFGAVLGYYCITSLTETESRHMQAGIPTKQEYSLEIIYYGDTIKN